MEDKILGIAAKVGTPLALAGLTIAILFLLYRTVIRSGLLSTVRASHTFIILNRILTFVFVLSLIAIVLGVASYLATSLIEPPRKTSDLEITDVAVISRPSFPILDLKFRNLGRDVAYIKKVSLEVIDKKIEKDTNDYYAGPSTWQYNVLLDPHSDQRSYEIATSQIIPSNGTDRFNLVVGQQSSYGEINYTDYHLRLRVFYNENQATEIKDVKVRVYSPPHFLSPAKPVGPTLEDRLVALDSPDPLIVAEIATVVGAVGSKDAVQKLLSILKQDPDRYISYYEKAVLTKPYYNERGLPPDLAVKDMYISIFWALNQITGDYHEGAIKEMLPNARAIGEEALKAVKEG